jgi:hypothetical protein
MSECFFKKALNLEITWTSLVFPPQKMIEDGLYLDYITILMTIMNMKDYRWKTCLEYIKEWASINNI